MRAALPMSVGQSVLYLLAGLRDPCALQLYVRAAVHCLLAVLRGHVARAAVRRRRCHGMPVLSTVSKGTLQACSIVDICMV